MSESVDNQINLGQSLFNLAKQLRPDLKSDQDIFLLAFEFQTIYDWLESSTDSTPSLYDVEMEWKDRNGR